MEVEGADTALRAARVGETLVGGNAGHDDLENGLEILGRRPPRGRCLIQHSHDIGGGAREGLRAAPRSHQDGSVRFLEIGARSGSGYSSARVETERESEG